MVLRWFVVAVGAAGCASTPPSNVRPLLDVDATTGRVATTAAAPIQFAIEFAADGVRMPQSLTLDGANLLASGTCPSEGGAGIGVVPAVNAVAPAHGGPSDGSTTLTVSAAGPVVAQVIVDWTAPYSCHGSQTASGTSTFTIFPGGRIVRHDVAAPSTQMLTSPTDCGCAGRSEFRFTSFWAFAQTAQTVTATGMPLEDGAAAGCAVYANHTVGVSWPDTSTRIVPGTGVSAFVHDWVGPAVTTLLPEPKELISAIQLSKETAPARCGAVLGELADVPLFIDGSDTTTDENGIYDDSNVHTSRVVLSAMQQIPHGFVVAIDVGAFAEVVRTPATSEGWFATQPLGSHLTLFWFRDGLAQGETITIDPR